MQYLTLSPEYVEMRRRTASLAEDSIISHDDVMISNSEIKRQRAMTKEESQDWQKEHFLLMQELDGYW